jgi:hypothetical protein
MYMWNECYESEHIREGDSQDSKCDLLLLAFWPPQILECFIDHTFARVSAKVIHTH